jgi:hypothetical protein
MEVSVALSPGYWSSCRDGSGAGRFGGAASAFADKPTSYKLTKGDAAILRLLGAAEILETDRCERVQVDPSRARNRPEAALVRLRAIVGSSRVVQT